MEKHTTNERALKDLLSIKEFSRMSSLEQSTLRYWDNIGLFSPAVRGKNNSYRYYSLDQLPLVNFIKVLSSLGVPLKVIGEIKENRSPETILHLMEQKELALDTELTRLQEAYSTIHTLRGVIRQGVEVPDADHIGVQTLEALPLVLGPANEPRAVSDFHGAFVRYCNYAKENRINLNTPIGGYFTSMERFEQEPGMPVRFYSVDPQGRGNRPAGTYLVCYTRGGYEQLDKLAQRMEAYAAANGLTFSGPVYVLHLLNEISSQNPSDYLAQVCAAVTPADGRALPAIDSDAAS